MSEVVLSHLDEYYEKSKLKNKIKYIRYVDDIKIMAKNEIDLRKMLSKLDYASKQVGLFPQSSKVEMHEIVNINDEIKKVSHIFSDINIRKIKGDHKSIEKMIFQLTRNNIVINKTDFKIYLNNTIPNAKVTNRVLDILNNQPELFESVTLYLSSYSRNISPKIIERIINELEQPEVFQIINANVLMAIQDKISDNELNDVLNFIYKRWRNKNKEPLTPIYRVTLMSYLLKYNRLSYNEVQDFLKNEDDWWVLKSILRWIDINQFGEPSYKQLLQIPLCHKSIDVSICAAQQIINNNLKNIEKPSTMNYMAQKQLKYAGIINKSARRPSRIQDCLEKICNKELPDLRWKIIFREDHSNAENKAIRANSLSKVDTTALINALDSFNDLLILRLSKHDHRLGTYTLGQPGSWLNDVNYNKKFKQHYPAIFNYCKFIHEKRLESDLSHAVTKKTQKATGRIKYDYQKVVKKLLYDAVDELASKW